MVKYNTPGLSLTEPVVFAVANQLARSAESRNDELAALKGRGAAFDPRMKLNPVLSAANINYEWEWKPSALSGVEAGGSVWEVILDCARLIAHFSQVGWGCSS